LWFWDLESIKALAELAGELLEVGGWNVAECPADQFLPDGVVFGGEFGDFIASGIDGLVLSALTGGGYARGDFGVALAVPFYKGGFGDAKRSADLCEAGAMETQADEFVTDVI